MVREMMQIVPMDHLSALFSHFRPTARAFYSGNLCTTAEFGEGGHLHLLKSGQLRLQIRGEPDVLVSEPAVMFFPRGKAHRIVADPASGADLACAHVSLGDHDSNPIAQGLPEFVAVPLASSPNLAEACHLLWAEAFAAADGKQAALDLLFDYFLILLIRYIIASRKIAGGVIAGLSDPQLARALTAIHDDPGHLWSLDALAEVAGMSRTRFAAAFRQTVGRTAIDYLGSWRMVVGQGLLAEGKSVKAIAARLGYDSIAAFSRAFAKYTGHSPRDWATIHRTNGDKL